MCVCTYVCVIYTHIYVFTLIVASAFYKWKWEDCVERGLEASLLVICVNRGSFCILSPCYSFPKIEQNLNILFIFLLPMPPPADISL